MKCALIPGALAGIVLATLPAPAAAQETLNYEVVVHTTEVHTVPVPARDRQVGVAAFSGLAIFDDGRIASHRYAGGFDFLAGSGRFHGYALWAFEDGSQLGSSYVGEATATPAGGVRLEGRHADLSGTGAYAGVKGDGSFTGRRIDHLEDGGDTYQRGTLRLVRPKN